MIDSNLNASKPLNSTLKIGQQQSSAISRNDYSPGISEGKLVNNNS